MFSFPIFFHQQTCYNKYSYNTSRVLTFNSYTCYIWIILIHKDSVFIFVHVYIKQIINNDVNIHNEK